MAAMKIEAVCADLHIFDEEVNWTAPLRIALFFDDDTFIRLGVGSDGETMIVDRRPLEGPFDMGKYGRVKVLEFTDHLDPTLRNSLIGEPRIIHDGNGRAIGLAVPRVDAGIFCFWADGDELHWGSEDRLNGYGWPSGITPTLGDGLKL